MTEDSAVLRSETAVSVGSTEANAVSVRVSKLNTASVENVCRDVVAVETLKFVLLKG